MEDNKKLLSVRVQPNSSPNRARPTHHVVAPVATATASGWWSYLQSWVHWTLGGVRPKNRETRQDDAAVAEFRNPWPSWHKPTWQETWDNLAWGEDKDPCIKLAATHLPHDRPENPGPGKCPNFSDVDDWPHAPGAQAAALLRVQTPDFSFSPDDSGSSCRAKTTWLGHAGVLVQLAPLRPGGAPVRCLFDPIFSARCSPKPSRGPLRSFPAPCDVAALDPIDIYCISHNHSDHMDRGTVTAVWERNRPWLRFFVPSGNRSRLLEWGIPADRVVELDWWQCAHLTADSSAGMDTDADADSPTLKIWCTPAQHSSGGRGTVAYETLWSGWFLEHPGPRRSPSPYRVFFGDDTGFQFHDSPTWPPPPLDDEAAPIIEEKEEDNKFPACPAFAEIRARLGRPHLVLLPIWVGATYAHIRSRAGLRLPDATNPIPRASVGMTAATHLPPWDAVRVFRILTSGSGSGSGSGDNDDDEDEEGDDNKGSVAIALHWGTFVTNPIDVLKTLGQLEWACRAHGVGFGRALPDDWSEGSSRHGKREGVFLALNHGQSIVT